MGTTTFKNVVAISTRMGDAYTLDVNNPTPSYPRGTLTRAHSEILKGYSLCHSLLRTYMFISKRMDKVWYVCKIEYYAVEKMNKYNYWYQPGCNSQT